MRGTGQLTPVVLSCAQCECAREGQDVGTQSGEDDVEFGEAQVVADLETDVAHPGNGDGRDNLTAGNDPVALARPLRLGRSTILVGLGELDVEQMQLPVPGKQRAVGADEDVRVVHADTALGLVIGFVCLGKVVHTR